MYLFFGTQLIFLFINNFLNDLKLKSFFYGICIQLNNFYCLSSNCSSSISYFFSLVFFVFALKLKRTMDVCLFFGLNTLRFFADSYIVLFLIVDELAFCDCKTPNSVDHCFLTNHQVGKHI